MSINTAGQTGRQVGHTDTDDQNQSWKKNQGNRNLLKAAVARRVSQGKAKATPQSLSVAFAKSPTSPNVVPRVGTERRTFGPINGTR